MNSVLSTLQLNRLLPALSLLAEDVGDRRSIDARSLGEILASVREDQSEGGIYYGELSLWARMLEDVRNHPNDNSKKTTIAELKNRGIPEFPAMLAVYVATNHRTSAASFGVPMGGVEKSTTDEPAEPFHKLLPDHGWHNDLTWQLLPDWIKTNTQLKARLRNGEQVVGKNVRYKMVANKLIRRLRDRTTVAHAAGIPVPPATTHASYETSNVALLRQMIAQRSIRLYWGGCLDQAPVPLPASFRYEKVEGMLLGIAIGDALGATSEGIQPSHRHRLYEEIVDYRTDRRPGHAHPKGDGTDDTQMSFWTVEQLLADGELIPESLARKFCEHRIWGIGNTTKKFVENFRDKRRPWYSSGSESLTNGALMRIAPIVLPYLRNPRPSMYADAAIATMMTHNDFANNASTVAFVHMLWQLLGRTAAPEPEWWIETYCGIAKGLEGNTSYHRISGPIGEYSGPLWLFTSKVCTNALKRKLTVEEACKGWGSGSNLFETVPSVLYVLATHGDDPEEAIIRAVNDTVDNDTIASIVGAAVGALHGLSGMPERWLRNLTGRIRDGGNSEVFKLVARSKEKFWLQSPQGVF